MNALPLLIGLSLLLMMGAVVALFWAVEHDQFEDLQTPELLPLMDGFPAEQSRRDRAPPP
jgi:cbb3-type cytochrome oxidase maturation protein